MAGMNIYSIVGLAGSLAHVLLWGVIAACSVMAYLRARKPTSAMQAGGAVLVVLAVGLAMVQGLVLNLLHFGPSLHMLFFVLQTLLSTCGLALFAAGFCAEKLFSRNDVIPDKGFPVSDARQASESPISLR